MFSMFEKPANKLTQYNNRILDNGSALLIEPKSGKVEWDQADESLFWLPNSYGHTPREYETYEIEARRRFLQYYATKIALLRGNFSTLDPSINYISVAHPFGWHAFGHLFDSLQRLKHAVGQVPEPWKVLHSRAHRIVDFEGHLEKFGVSSDRLVEITAPVIVPNLWISPLQDYMAQLTEENYQWIYDAYTRDVPRTEPKRLYITRNHVQEGKRGVLNENAVVSTLSEHGFTVVTGLEPLDVMLEQFFNAEMIIAPHGSAIANSMFSQSHCRILEFCPANRPDQSLCLKRKKPTDYTQLFMPSGSEYNITIPLDIIESFVKEPKDTFSSKYPTGTKIS